MTATSPSARKTRTPPCESPTAKYRGKSSRSSERCGNVTIAVADAPRSRRTAPVSVRWSVHASSLLATAGRSTREDTSSYGTRRYATSVSDETSLDVLPTSRYVGRRAS